ncbi:alpha/beta hydrolase [Paenibacillus pini]|uniref:Lysophospholipase n=1 Tax=Paenibacillus pini JCM 16418 TaxID=1236976 RepID=W7YF65_9BACL|nr:alpha/beta hydrolase [Paenibacillus pini]GAF06138.1 lysophospholipase [Paenibacillus pini JCM 16418]
MIEQSFIMTDPTGFHVHVYQWLPDSSVAIKGVLQIAHGMCETAERYTRFAEKLTSAGYTIYAHDQRGHGLTAGSLSQLGNAGVDGFNRMATDIIQLGEFAAEQHPNVPLFLMGHSMGSFLVQKVMSMQGSHKYDGFILSGTNGPQSRLMLGKSLARLQARMLGEGHRSLLMNGLVFGAFNRSFSPSRTDFDWLSRDPKEVDKYIEDPYCGAICAAGFFRDFFGLLQDIQQVETRSRIARNKPIYMFSGEKDPVGMSGKGVRRLESIYRDLSIEDVECRLYPEGRHEMLNEINRDEVTNDVIDWLDRHLRTDVILEE